MEVNNEQLADALKCLIDNGIEADEAQCVLEALCFILLDQEIDLYQDNNTITSYCA